jgi:hypothetical protein
MAAPAKSHKTTTYSEGVGHVIGNGWLRLRGQQRQLWVKYSGVRYPGGNPRGPASHDNWEGGFHPTAVWVIKETERT